MLKRKVVHSFFVVAMAKKKNDFKFLSQYCLETNVIKGQFFIFNFFYVSFTVYFI